jgi:hypothetical protein
MAIPMRAKVTLIWGQRIIAAGDIVSSEDPVMKKHAALFEAVVAPVIEQATAAPGERRTIRPRKEPTDGAPA